MKINNFLSKKNISDTIIKSIIYKTIIEIFLKEKKIDITNFLISIKQIGNIFLVKTTKPIINTELYFLNEKIKKKSIEKLKKLGFNFENFNIKYK